MPIPAVPEPHRYGLPDLERETGVPGRTIRFYITQGLMPPALGRGPSATYDLGHLLRLQAIKSLKADHLPLEEIKERLGDLSDRDLTTLLQVQTRPVEESWRRIVIHPDIELHVRQHGATRNLALEEAVELIVGLSRPVIERLPEE